MPAVLAAIIDVAHVGLPVLFVLIAIETMGVPVPGETALITAGIVASRGDLPIEAVIVVAAVAAIAGDNVGFAIGRRYGRRLLTAAGPFERHRRQVIEVAEPFFDRHGPKAVFLGRWVTGLRITSAWMAGTSQMRWRVFLPYNAAGGILWALSIGLLAYLLGHTAERIVHTVGIGGLALAVLGGGLLWYLLRRRRRHAEKLVEDAVRRAEDREAARGAAEREDPVPGPGAPGSRP